MYISLRGTNACAPTNNQRLLYIHVDSLHRDIYACSKNVAWNAFSVKSLQFSKDQSLPTTCLATLFCRSSGAEQAVSSWSRPGFTCSSAADRGARSRTARLSFAVLIRFLFFLYSVRCSLKQFYQNLPTIIVSARPATENNKK